MDVLAQLADIIEVCVYVYLSIGALLTIIAAIFYPRFRSMTVIETIVIPIMVCLFWVFLLIQALQARRKN